MPEPVCVLCPVYRPDADPRPAESVCPADWFRLERDLLALPALVERLIAGTDDTVDDRLTPVRDRDGAIVAGALCDPIAGQLPAAGEIAARAMTTPVAGTRSAPVPINIDVHDLTAPARAGLPLGDPIDQIGYLPAATVLDAWARHIRDQLRPDFHLPAADVPALVRFLHRHLEQACRDLPDDITGLAVAVRSLGGAMRVLLQDVDPIQQPLLGLRCEHCQRISTLVPWQTREYIECQACGQLYSATERPNLGRRQLADVRKPRHVRLSGLVMG